MAIDQKELKDIVMKLLEKKGDDPRLTPRLLREKTEQKMHLEKDALFKMKSQIMGMIESWWKSSHPSSGNSKTPKNDKPSTTDQDPLISLRNYARAVGLTQNFFKEQIYLDKSNKDKASLIRKRLRDDGHEVSDAPSSDDIEKAKEKYQMKIEMKENMKENDVLAHSRRRVETVSNESKEDDVVGNVKQEKGAPPVDDEEAEADF
mmetsp:Transcript_34598/g.32964  ORF Transcript_34598/g.32964 Transcript_34598/m.32964 type:complete len:205 (+) Transcript_34598:87-701(+)|eukprot:CAMPEP_0119040218 /NCGR_PEP_ID=MMETSP1177-20130426/10073_1 /TAXON_ID=2985 /ORGANISM="Ochromonas sp, Strain CCMP1899" /LENGTH=204 /DNA_ID=CAMNT_0007005045 /DNA_START=33 /DNA_END=647 /DNA_ORIENTATION=+